MRRIVRKEKRAEVCARKGHVTTAAGQCVRCYQQTRRATRK